MAGLLNSGMAGQNDPMGLLKQLLMYKMMNQNMAQRGVVNAAAKAPAAGAVPPQAAAAQGAAQGPQTGPQSPPQAGNGQPPSMGLLGNMMNGTTPGSGGAMPTVPPAVQQMMAQNPQLLQTYQQLSPQMQTYFINYLEQQLPNQGISVNYGAGGQ